LIRKAARASLAAFFCEEKDERLTLGFIPMEAMIGREIMGFLSCHDSTGARPVGASFAPFVKSVNNQKLYGELKTKSGSPIGS